MRNKKGFTLIELLAVIVILAIIALIAVPVIMNVINKENKSAFKDTAYGVISAGELYYAEQQLELNGMSAEETFTFPNDIGTLQVKGNVPDGTVLKVNTNGETALAMSNGKYCVTKEYSDKDVIITEDYTTCELEKTLSDLVTTSTELGVDNIEACVEKGQVCEIDEDGTAFAIQVNDTDTYKFYVINDDGNTITLMMTSNLYAEEDATNPNVAWINEEDYLAAGGSSENWGNMIDENTYGPLTALEALKTRTSNWTNIAEYSYELNYETGTYSGEFVQNVRARLPKYSDMYRFQESYAELEYWVLPSWLIENLKNNGDNNTSGYWLSDAVTTTAPIYANYVYYAGYDDHGLVDDGLIIGHEVHEAIYIGVRPVITLAK